MDLELINILNALGKEKTGDFGKYIITPHYTYPQFLVLTRGAVVIANYRKGRTYVNLTEKTTRSLGLQSPQISLLRLNILITSWT